MINCNECDLFNVCPRVTTRQDLICEHYERIRPRTEYTNAELYKLIDRLTRDCIGVDFYARDLSI